MQPWIFPSLSSDVDVFTIQTSNQFCVPFGLNKIVVSKGLKTARSVLLNIVKYNDTRRSKVINWDIRYNLELYVWVKRLFNNAFLAHFTKKSKWAYAIMNSLLSLLSSSLSCCLGYSFEDRNTRFCEQNYRCSPQIHIKFYWIMDYSFRVETIFIVFFWMHITSDHM